LHFCGYTKQTSSSFGSESALNRRASEFNPAKEDLLRGPVEELFPATRFFVKREVPFGLKRIDLVFKERTNGRNMIAVELKVRNWKRAIWQAVQNCQIAAYSYVALPTSAVSPVDISMLGVLGLGLIVTDERKAKIVFPAKRSQYINKRMANVIADLVESSSDV